MRISDGSSDVCSSDHEAQIGQAEQRIAILIKFGGEPRRRTERVEQFQHRHRVRLGLFVAHRGAAVDVVAAQRIAQFGGQEDHAAILPCSASCASRWRDSSQSAARSEEHTSELQSLMRISYAVFCFKQKTSKTSYNRHK